MFLDMFSAVAMMPTLTSWLKNMPIYKDLTTTEYGNDRHRYK